MEISELNPKLVFKNFYALTRIPRPSGFTSAVAKYLVEFGKSHGAESFLDSAGNVVMRKGATSGYENLEPVVLQAHMDMVPQAVKGSTHNFETDPIECYIDGEWIRTHGTTLGSDDGMGVAAAMAIIEDESVEHGPLEVLITADEETGMYGARGLSSDTLKAKYMLNLDSETEGEITIGCAGGQDVECRMSYEEMEVKSEGMVAFKISIKGLRGGHSGLEINEGRGNANKLMARILTTILDTGAGWLCSWHGGNMRNAIPRDSEAVVLVSSSHVDEVRSIVLGYNDVFNSEYAVIEKGKIKVEIGECSIPSKAMPDDVQCNLVSAVMAAHDGVLRYIPSIPSVVETSSNLAIINAEGGEILVAILARSSCDSMKDYLCDSLSCCFTSSGFDVELVGGYGGWQPNFSSPLVANMSSVYKEMYGKSPLVQVCHAGLECGIIGVTYPEMDMASFGPTLLSPHTPDECCHIPSVSKFYGFLVEMLKHIPAKS